VPLTAVPPVTRATAPSPSVGAPARPCRPAAARARALHLIDVENLSGCCAPTTADLHYVLRCYQRQVGIAATDSSLAATDVVLARRAAFVYAASGIRFRTGHGRSGADDALLESVGIGWLADRFGLLVIASGDGIFTGLVRAATAAGLVVWQVAGRGRTSTRLAAATGNRVTLRLGPPRTDSVGQWRESGQHPGSALTA
jgi:hypothetical protein